MEYNRIEKLKDLISEADAIVIGAGAGLSMSAGFTYEGERFNKYFSDFEEKFHFKDMYTGGFFPYPTEEEYWAFWSRYIYINRYMDIPFNTYDILLRLVQNKDYFVITTNVDHCFQKSGFDKKKLFFTQGDYGLFQCSKPCHNNTYDNKDIIAKMYWQQKDMKIPSDLIPKCPICGRPMTMNLRSDDHFVEDNGWHQAYKNYSDFLENHEHDHILYLELGVGYNTPSIIKFSFQKMTYFNQNSFYACINSEQSEISDKIQDRSLLLCNDIHATLIKLLDMKSEAIQNETDRTVGILNP